MITAFKHGRKESPVEGSDNYIADLSERIRSEIGATRASKGSQPVATDQVLCNIATAQCNLFQSGLEILDANHLAQRLGYRGKITAYIAGTGSHDAMQVMDQILADKEFRAKLEDPGADEVGCWVGGGPYNVYVAIVLGKADGNPGTHEAEPSPLEAGLRDGISFMAPSFFDL